MVNFGGTRTAPRKLKFQRTLKIVGRTAASKKTLKGKTILGLNTKNLERMLGENKTKRKISNIKVAYEKTKNVEGQLIQTTNKFIKLFNSILNDEEKYIDARVKIESMLGALDDSKGGNPIERHNISNKKFKSKLEKKISDDIIRTYRNILKVSKDVYETSNNEEQREAASIFLIGLIEELYDEFFPSKKTNHTMNVNTENTKNNTKNNSNLDDLLNMFKKTGI
jgi:hypothetical protein